MANKTKETSWKKVLLEKRYPLWVLLLITVLYVLGFLTTLRIITGTWF